MLECKIPKAVDLFLKVFFSNMTTENPLDFLCKAALYTNGLQTINVALMTWTFYPQKTQVQKTALVLLSQYETC